MLWFVNILEPNIELPKHRYVYVYIHIYTNNLHVFALHFETKSKA